MPWEGLEARVEALETIQQRMLADLEALRADRLRSDTRMRLAALEQAIKTVDANRESDTQHILAFLRSLAVSPPPSPRKPVGLTPVTVSGSGEHIVQPGETLSRIAAAYGTTVEAIQEANHVPNANVLRVGQRLVIPEAARGKKQATPSPELQ